MSQTPERSRFATAMVKRRQELKMRQEVLAEAVGLTQQQIANLETNKQHAKASTARAIITALGLDPRLEACANAETAIAVIARRDGLSHAAAAQQLLEALKDAPRYNTLEEAKPAHAA